MGQPMFVGRGVCAVAVLPIVALSMLSSGCALDTGAEAGGENLGTQQEELTIAGSGEVGQFAHRSEQRLTDTPVNATCFLTEFGGSWHGGGEFTRIEKRPDNFYLVIGSQQGGNNNAAAKCVRRPQTATATWTKGQARKFLQHEGFCALQAIKGDFAGGGEQVIVSKDGNGDWWVSGSTLSPQTLSATAGCITLTSNVVRSQWAATSWDVFGVDDTIPSTRFCGLQGIKGGLRSSKEQLRVILGPFDGRTGWRLHGESQFAGGNRLIGGTMGCVAGPDQPLP